MVWLLCVEIFRGAVALLALLADPLCGQWLRKLGPKYRADPLLFADRGRQGVHIVLSHCTQARLPRLGAMPVRGDYAQAEVSFPDSSLPIGLEWECLLALCLLPESLLRVHTSAAGGHTPYVSTRMQFLNWAQRNQILDLMCVVR